MKFLDIINEEGFQDKKDKLTKKAEAYYKLYKTGTFEYNMKHSLGNWDSMITHTFRYRLSDDHRIVVPMGSNIPSITCEAHVTDITDKELQGTFSPMSHYVARGYIRRIFERKNIECHVLNTTGDVEPRDALFEGEEEQSSEDMMKDHDAKQLKKLESVYKFYKRGSVIIYPDGQKRHTVDYVLSDNAEFKNFNSENKDYYYIVVPEITLFVRSKELYDTLQYFRYLEKQGSFKSGSELEIIKNKIMIPFRKKNIQTDIFYSAVKIKRIKPQLNEQDMNLDMDKLKKKVEACYKYFKKGIFTIEYVHSEGILHEFKYELSDVHEINYDGEEPLINCDVHVESLNEDKKQIRPYLVEESITKIFAKHKILVQINNFSGDILQPKTKKKMNEEVSPEQKEYLDGVRKKAFKAYQHFRKGKVKWYDDIYEYEFSEDANAGGFGLLEGKKRYCIIYPSELTIKGHGMYKKEHPDYPLGYSYEQQHLSFEEIQKLIGKLFDKYKVGIRLKDHSIINRVKGDNSQLTEEDEIGGENSEEKIREVQRKKCESVYKFLKKGTFQQTYVNVRDVDNYEYQLSDEFEILTHKKGTPTIKCGAHIKCLTKDKKMRPHIILLHLGKIFEKYHITLSVETLTGDIDMVSPAKPFGYDD